MPIPPPNARSHKYSIQKTPTTHAEDIDQALPTSIGQRIARCSSPRPAESTTHCVQSPRRDATALHVKFCSSSNRTIVPAHQHEPHDHLAIINSAQKTVAQHSRCRCSTTCALTSAASCTACTSRTCTPARTRSTGGQPRSPCSTGSAAPPCPSRRAGSTPCICRYDTPGS